MTNDFSETPRGLIQNKNQLNGTVVLVMAVAAIAGVFIAVSLIDGRKPPSSQPAVVSAEHAAHASTLLDGAMKDDPATRWDGNTLRVGRWWYSFTYSQKQGSAKLASEARGGADIYISDAYTGKSLGNVTKGQVNIYIE